MNAQLKEGLIDAIGFVVGSLAGMLLGQLNMLMYPNCG